MATFRVNGVLPVEVVAAAASEFLQVVSGKALLVEGADPTIGFLSQGETHFFDALTGPITALNASPSGYCTIRTSAGTQIAVADGADVGTPGAWTTAPEQAPLTFGDVTGVTASPTTIWQTGEFMVLGNGEPVYWDGTAWAEGIAPVPPLATGATAGIPGAFTPGGSSLPFDLAAVIAAGIVANPLTTWTIGQGVVLGDTNQAHWDGAAWIAGTAP